MMDTAIMLCDHAEAVNGKLFLNGGGINVFRVSPQPPHSISTALGVVIHVPWTATNQAHHLTVDLIDEDGQPVAPWVPDGAPPRPAVKVDSQFNVGRPVRVQAGAPQSVPLAINFQLALRSLGGYAFVVSIDDTEVKRLSFRLEAKS